MTLLDELAPRVREALGAPALPLACILEGGVRSVADAAVYIEMVESTLGAGALVPARFRIGASGLLADIEAVLAIPQRAKPAQ